MLLQTLLAILVLRVAVRSTSSSNNPPLWDNLDQFSAPLTSKLPMSDFSIVPWEPGVISQGCMDAASGDEQDPATFSAYSVTFDDVSEISALPLGPLLMAVHISASKAGTSASRMAHSSPSRTWPLLLVRPPCVCDSIPPMSSCKMMATVHSPRTRILSSTYQPQYSSSSTR